MLRLTAPATPLLSACADLYAAAFAQPPWCESYTPHALISYFDAFCNQDTRRCYILTDDVRPVGIALCTIVPCPDAPFLRIEDLCIDPSVQRQGCGSTMLRLLRDEARALGCDCIMLSTQRGFPAHAFYLKNGFSEIDSSQLYLSLQ